MVERGARVYAANGCIYCHSQQVRADYAANDIERGWGNRRSAPRDYIFDRPVLLGKMRMGQDIANIGARAPKEQESPPPGGAPAPAGSPAQPSAAPAAAASPATQGAAASPATSPAPQKSATPAPAAPTTSPSPAPQGAAVSGPPLAASPKPSEAPWPVQTAGFPPMYSAAWHHVHLYSPRSINLDSNMPSYRFLYRNRRISDARSADALQLTGSDAPPEGWEVVPTVDAKCLVAYLMALNQSHPLNEVKSVGGAPAPPAPAGGSPAPSSSAPKK